MAGSEEEALELSALERLERIGGDGFVVEMIELFLEHAPERIRSAGSASDEGDLQGVYRAAHSLKSTAANVGARQLQAVAARVEGQAAAGDGETIPPLIEQMRHRFAVVRDRLEAERKRRAGGREEERGET